MNNLKKRAFSLFLICALLVAIAGVGNPATTYAASKKTHLKKETISIVAGNAYQQKLIDKNGKTIKASRIKWKSRRKTIARISKSGIVNAVKAGTVKMTAKYKGRTYRFTVKVKEPFKDGEKPTGLKIKYIYSDIEIDLSWNGLKNAKKYQVYLSKDGSPFELIGSTDQESFGYRSNEEGSELTFKVRAVCKNYKSSFSSAESITIPGQPEL